VPKTKSSLAEQGRVPSKESSLAEQGRVQPWSAKLKR
jgi:hypothetical protein